MSTDNNPKPDLTLGIAIDRLPEGQPLLGDVKGEDVVLTRSGDEFFAVGDHCTHYSQSLAEGLVIGEELRCPLHHACFSLRTGEALRAPAFDPIPCWRVERIGEKVFVREKLPAPAPRGAARQTAPNSVVIVGGGAAGLAAADMLRRRGYQGSLTMISADDSPPYDRPNVSKDYLSGAASDE